MLKFSQMPYDRPNVEAVMLQMNELCAKMQDAKTYEEAKAVFLEKEAFEKHYFTMYTLASVRNTIDTRDEFYDAEMKFWNVASPELEEYSQAWTMAMLESPFRADFSAEYGDLMFKNAEISLKTFSPEIIPELQ